MLGRGEGQTSLNKYHKVFWDNAMLMSEIGMTNVTLFLRQCSLQRLNREELHQHLAMPVLLFWYAATQMIRLQSSHNRYYCDYTLYSAFASFLAYITTMSLLIFHHKAFKKLWYKYKCTLRLTRENYYSYKKWQQNNWPLGKPSLKKKRNIFYTRVWPPPPIFRKV